MGTGVAGIPQVLLCFKNLTKQYPCGRVFLVNTKSAMQMLLGFCQSFGAGIATGTLKIFSSPAWNRKRSHSRGWRANSRERRHETRLVIGNRRRYGSIWACDPVVRHARKRTVDER